MDYCLDFVCKLVAKEYWQRMEEFPSSCLGGKDCKKAHVYSSAKVYYPPFLTMGEYSCLADDVECYNVAPITIGANTTVSKGAYLCTASHDVTSPLNPLITAPIVIGDQAWIGARAFVGMGVTIGQGAVVGARV